MNKDVDNIVIKGKYFKNKRGNGVELNSGVKVDSHCDKSVIKLKHCKMKIKRYRGRNVNNFDMMNSYCANNSNRRF